VLQSPPPPAASSVPGQQQPPIKTSRQNPWAGRPSCLPPFFFPSLPSPLPIFLAVKHILSCRHAAWPAHTCERSSWKSWWWCFFTHSGWPPSVRLSTNCSTPSGSSSGPASPGAARGAQRHWTVEAAADRASKQCTGPNPLLETTTKFAICKQRKWGRLSKWASRRVVGIARPVQGKQGTPPGRHARRRSLPRSRGHPCTLCSRCGSPSPGASPGPCRLVADCTTAADSRHLLLAMPTFQRQLQHHGVHSRLLHSHAQDLGRI
jgi:hypothetical protein